MIRLKKLLLENDTDRQTQCWKDGHEILLRAIDYWIDRINHPGFIKQYIKAHGGEKFDTKTQSRNYADATRVDKTYTPLQLDTDKYKIKSDKLPGITYVDADRELKQYIKVLESYKKFEKFKIVSGRKVNGSIDNKLGAAWYSPSVRTISLNCSSNLQSIMYHMIHELTHALYEEVGPMNPESSWKQFSNQIWNSDSNKYTINTPIQAQWKQIKVSDPDLIEKRFPEYHELILKIIKKYNNLNSISSYHYDYFKKYIERGEDYSKYQTEMLARLSEMMVYLNKDPGELITVDDFKTLLDNWESVSPFFFYAWVSAYPNIPNIPQTVNALNNLVVQQDTNRNVSKDNIT